MTSMERLKEDISKEKKTVQEINSLFDHLQKTENVGEKKLVSLQITSLKNSLKKTNQSVSDSLKKINIAIPLNPPPQQELIQQQPVINIEQPAVTLGQSLPGKFAPKRKFFEKEKLLTELERLSLKRLKKKGKKVVGEKIKKPSRYVEMANKTFSNYSRSLIQKGKFKKVERNIIKAKLSIIPTSYISILLFTTLSSIIVSIFIFMFLLFFNISATLPIITLVTENIGIRFLKVFWVLFAIPIGTFLLMYLYPSMEESSAESKINQELPFATINMAAISGSMIDPSNIFKIIVSTKEYPYVAKEFTRLINDINVYGYDLITALKRVAVNSPSKKLSNLLNGIATTISSGGNLPDFFNNRAETLLFDYKISREKDTKTSETFMDIYISVVIAAPMILMLLLIMMRVSGLGIALSTSTITLMTLLGVFMINIVFLTFLHLKRPAE